MNLLGRWSLASFMKVVIDVAYFGLLVIIALICAVSLWLALTPARRGLRDSLDLKLPVRYQLDPSMHPFSSTDAHLKAASIMDSQGDLVVKGAASSAVTLWATFGFALISLATALFVLNRLRAIFRTLKDQNPFVTANPSRIRMIGLALMLGQLISAAGMAWLTPRVTRGLSIAGITFENRLSFTPWVFFSGVILIMLAEVFRLGAQMKGDLETARKIQFDLVPGEAFRLNDAVVCARMTPARAVGGDFYDYRDLEDGRLAVVVGDVMGKGLPAALLMSSVLGSVRVLLSAGLRGKELVAALNRYVCADTSGGRLVTLFYGELDITTGDLTYVNAGHNPPLLSRAEGGFERLEPTAMILGFAPDGAVETCQARIGPADRLLVFTDGLSEAFNRKNEEYGEPRLRDSLARSRMLPPPAAVDRLVADVRGFCGSAPQHDDMTLLLVARQPA